MTTTALINFIISLVMWALLAIAYTYLLNRKKIADRKRFVLIATITFGVTILLHVVIAGYIYTTIPFVLLLFFILPFLVCLVVSSRFVLGKKEKE